MEEKIYSDKEGSKRFDNQTFKRFQGDVYDVSANDFTPQFPTKTISLNDAQTLLGVDKDYLYNKIDSGELSIIGDSFYTEQILQLRFTRDADFALEVQGNLFTRAGGIDETLDRIKAENAAQIERIDSIQTDSAEWKYLLKAIRDYYSENKPILQIPLLDDSLRGELLNILPNRLPNSTENFISVNNEKLAWCTSDKEIIQEIIFNAEIVDASNADEENIDDFIDNAADETPLVDSADDLTSSKQKLDNLPDELLLQPRFFRTGRNSNGVFNVKVPVDKGWNNPANQRRYTDLHFTDKHQMAGFDIVGHGKAADYLVLDLDHVLNDEGNFINDDARRWYNYIVSECITYCEKSVSGHGLHFIYKPSEGKFPIMASGNNACLYLDGNAKIEIFYKPQGRHFVLTGDVYDCEPKTSIATDCGIVDALLAEIGGRNTISSSSIQGERIFGNKNIDTELALNVIKFIPCNSYKTWIDVGMALFHNGNTVDDWVEWSKTDSREGKFKDGECAQKWTSFKDVARPLTIGTLIYYAQQNGYTLPKPENKNNPAHMKELADAVAFLQSLNTENLNHEMTRDFKILRQIAMCYEYGEGVVADNFVELIIQSKFPNVKRENLMRDIKRQQKDIVAEKKAYKCKLYYKKQQAQAAKLNEKRQAEREQFKELLKMEQTDERDEQMRSILLNACTFDKKKRIVRSIANGKIIFGGDPVINGLFGYDEFSDRIVFLKSPTWRNTKRGDTWKSTDDIQLAFYIREHYADFSDQKTVNECIVHFAQKNSFHNIKNYLESLSWDGTPRAEKIFVDFLGVDDSPYSREVTLKWLLGAIARVYYPGCDFQMCLVLQGAQGIGKSFMMRKLGRDWHIALMDSLDDAHAIDAIQSAWIAEIEEFYAAKKAELNAVKSFLTRQSDDRRAPYARREEKFPRHCVFVITVNDKQFLRDPTGNRRFKILQCQSSMNQFKEGLTDFYIGQVWAEVMAKFNEMFASGFDTAKLRLSREIDEQAEMTATQFILDDGLQNEISAFLDTPIPEKAVWALLSRVERRKFIENGKVEFFRRADLINRYGALPKKWKTTEIQNSYYKIMTESKFDEDFEGDEVPNAQLPPDLQNNSQHFTHNAATITFYGVELRQHICASEIFNECFLGVDRRKNMLRISEVLDNLPNWRCVGREQNLDPQYSDQRKVYWRITE